MVESVKTTAGGKNELNKLLHKHIWHNRTLGLNLGFYFTMLAIFIIVVIENVVFWSIKKKAVTTGDFLFALKNDAGSGKF